MKYEKAMIIKAVLIIYVKVRFLIILVTFERINAMIIANRQVTLSNTFFCNKE